MSVCCAAGAGDVSGIYRPAIPTQVSLGAVISKAINRKAMLAGCGG